MRPLLIPLILCFGCGPKAAQPFGPTRQPPRRVQQPDARPVLEGIKRAFAGKLKKPLDLGDLLGEYKKTAPAVCRVKGKLRGIVFPSKLANSEKRVRDPGVLVYRQPEGPLWDAKEKLQLCAISLAPLKGGGTKLVTRAMVIDGCGASKLEKEWGERPSGTALLQLTCERVLQPMEANKPKRTTENVHVAFIQYRRGAFNELAVFQTRHGTMDVRASATTSEVREVQFGPPADPDSRRPEVFIETYKQKETGRNASCEVTTSCYRLNPAGNKLVPLKDAELKQLRRDETMRHVLQSCGKTNHEDAACG